MKHVPTLILGAGAAGMMCAAHAGPGTVVIDHAKAPGEKIRISGGGRCNFTNMWAGPENYLSNNPHFMKSALSRYTQWDFVDLVNRHGIAWHEKTLGQLFCDGKATQIVDMLVAELRRAGADLWLKTSVTGVTHDGTRFAVALNRDGRAETVSCDALVLATGGKPIPKMGASDLSLRLARQFGLAVTETRPALVPLTFSDNPFNGLAGVSCPVRATANGVTFAESLLFTHRGLSGPVILQASSFWREGDSITIDLDPSGAIAPALRDQRAQAGRVAVKTVLSRHLPARLVDHLAQTLPLAENVGDQSDAAIDALTHGLRNWAHKPTGSEGYRTAEVMLGGVETAELSSKTMAARTVPGLYVIGEAVDVTGWLGGYNFQWAWSSGWAAGQAISALRQNQ